MKKNFLGILGFMLVISCLVGCSNSKNDNEITIGYFPNLTHITTIVALENGYFAEEFGEDIKINTKTVANGGLFMEALLTKSIDVGTVGPGPAINFYIKNPKHRIISGAENGGAVLVVSQSSGIERIEDLDGKRVAIPVIGGTQDIMLRKALHEVNLNVIEQDGTVELFATAPSDIVSLFVQGNVDAAAVPEPWGYVLENQANGKLLLNWDNFAWGKDSTNTVVTARDDFLENEMYVDAYLKAHKKAVQFIQENPEDAQRIVIKHLKDITGKELDEKEVATAFSRLEITTEIHENVIQEMATISKEANYIKDDNIDGLIELKYLEKNNK